MGARVPHRVETEQLPKSLDLGDQMEIICPRSSRVPKPLASQERERFRRDLVAEHLQIPSPTIAEENAFQNESLGVLNPKRDEESSFDAPLPLT
jgi:hypothetical protein